MSEVNLVGVEGENFALGVAALDLQRDQPLLDLALQSFEAAARVDAALAHVLAQEQVAGHLLRDRAGAFALAGQQVERDCSSGIPDAQAEMPLESRVLGRDDRLPQ